MLTEVMARVTDGYDTVRVRLHTKKRIEDIQLRLRNQGHKVAVSDIIENALDASSGKPAPAVNVSKLSDDDVDVVRVLAQALEHDPGLADGLRAVARLYAQSAKKRK